MIVNPVIIGAIVVQIIISKVSKVAGAIVGFWITTGILVWGLFIYSDGSQIAIFGTPVSEGLFIASCLLWYVYDTKLFDDAKATYKGGTLSYEAGKLYTRIFKKRHEKRVYVKGMLVLALSFMVLLILYIQFVDWSNALYDHNAPRLSNKISDSITKNIDNFTNDFRPIKSFIVSRQISVLKNEDSLARISAIYKLGEFKDNRAVEPLITALKDRDSGVRMTASTVLGEFKDNRAVLPLIAALKDADSGVRKNATLALGKLKDSRAIEPLTSAMNDEDSDVRNNAAVVLGELKEALKNINN